MNAHDRRKQRRKLTRYRDTIRFLIDDMRAFLESPCPLRVIRDSNGDIIFEPDTRVCKVFNGCKMDKWEVSFYLKSIQEPGIPKMNFEGEEYYAIIEEDSDAIKGFNMIDILPEVKE